LPSFFSIRRLSSSLKLRLISFNSEEFLLSEDDVLLLDFSVFRFPDSFSGNLSPRGIISIPAGFFMFNVAASAEDTGVIDTEGLISDPILEDDLLTTDEDCDLDEEDDDDEVVEVLYEELVPPDPDEAGLALKALISR